MRRALLGVLLAPLLVAAAPRPIGEPVTIVVVPDMQNYVKTWHTGCSTASWGSPTDPDHQGFGCVQRRIYNAMRDYIVETRPALVVQVGDLIQNGNIEPLFQPHIQGVEWQRSQEFFGVIADAGIPILPARGDHDDYEGYIEHFGPANTRWNWTDVPGYLTHSPWGCDDGIDAHVATAVPHRCDDTLTMRVDMSGWNLLAFAISPDPDPEEQRFVDVLLRYGFPQDPFLLVSHRNVAGRTGLRVGGENYTTSCGPAGPFTCTGEVSTFSQFLWQDHILEFPERALITIGGHYVGDWTGWKAIDPNAVVGNGFVPDDSHSVHAGVLGLLCNYQSTIASDGGNGYLCLLRIDPSRSFMAKETYSPYMDHWATVPQCYNDEPPFGVDESLDHDGRLDYCIDPFYPPNHTGLIDLSPRLGGATSEAPRTAWTWDYHGREKPIGLVEDSTLTFDGNDVFIPDPAAEWNSSDFSRDPNAYYDKDRVFSVSVWFRCADSASSCVVGQLDDTASPSRYGLVIDAQGRAQFHWSSEVIQGSTPVCDGEWHQAFFGYNPGGAPNFRAWLDYVEVTDPNTPDGIVSRTTIPTDQFALGACWDETNGPNGFFRGEVDNLWIVTGNQLFRFHDLQDSMASHASAFAWGVEKREQDLRTHRFSPRITAWFPFSGAADPNHADDPGTTHYDQLLRSPAHRLVRYTGP